MLNSALELLQASIVGQTVRSAGYLYAVLETLHVLGIALLIGSIFAVDMRLLGLGRQTVSVTSTMRHLLPVCYVGFITAVITGLALLSAQATMIAASGAAPWKLGLLCAAGANAAAFHLGTGRGMAQWGEASMPPFFARVAALLSISAWTGVVLAGQMLPYT
ncbi:hypothetical protein FVA81_03500 (plasmid) [Rhizobium sp. WL3]|nr:hypothetical protein FVA81_03500 [Rhizobium sp. WL3]